MAKRTQIYLRTTAAILSELQGDFDDTGADKWTTTQVRRGINRALRRWAEKVRVPRLYTIPGGVVRGTVEYTLPDYIDGQFELQIQQPTGAFGNLASGSVWRTITGWDIYPSATEGRVLLLDYSFGAADARLIFWQPNGPIPVVSTLPVTSAQIDSDDTSVTLTTKPEIARSGYLKIDAEWMTYAGVTEAATTLTLTNLVRGIAGTTAATHSGGATVDWGVAAHRLDLYNTMLPMVGEYLHGIYLDRASQTARSYHEFQKRLYMQQADEMMRLIPGNGGIRQKVRRGAVGPVIGEVGWNFVESV